MHLDPEERQISSLIGVDLDAFHDEPEVWEKKMEMLNSMDSEKSHEKILVISRRSMKSSLSSGMSALIVRRSKLVEETVAILKSSDANTNPVAVISGPPSSGKSMIAMMTAQSDDCIQMFPDGVTWLNFGELSNFSTLEKRQAKLLKMVLQEVQILCGEPPNRILSVSDPLSADDCKDFIRMMIFERNMKILLVLDAVESIEDIVEFSYLGFVVLATTREDFSNLASSTVYVEPRLSQEELEDLHTDYNLSLDSGSTVFGLRLQQSLVLSTRLVTNESKHV